MPPAPVMRVGGREDRDWMPLRDSDVRRDLAFSHASQSRRSSASLCVTSCNARESQGHHASGTETT